MRRFEIRFWVGVSLLLTTVPVVWAQQPQQPQQTQQQQTQTQDSQDQGVQPIPAYRSPLAGLTNNGDETQPGDLMPDARSLSGAQDLTLGLPSGQRSYWQPKFNVNGTADSDALGASQGSGWTGYGSVLGGVDLHKIAGRSDLLLSYIGGGTFSNDSGVGNSIIQELQFAGKMTFRRSVLSIFDQFSYLPETNAGYSGLAGVALPGGGSAGLQNGFQEGQSILTARGQRISNTSLAQLDTFLSARSSFTFVGGYSVLDFFGDDLLNSGDIIFQAGYNHQIGREDTIAVFYRFNGYRYGGFDQSINDNSVQVAYAKRVTGRLAFRIAGGPEFAFLNQPITGIASTATGGTGTTTPSPNSTLVTWSVSTSLTYQLQRTNLGVTYNHGVSGGSGVLAGSINDNVTGTVGRQLSRTYAAGVNFGYSRNNGLAVLSTTSPVSGQQAYDYWFGGVNLTHPLGRSADLFLNYQLQYQNSNSTFCIGTVCQGNVTRHTVSVGFNWRGRPMVF